MKYKKLSDLTCKIGSGVTPRGGEKAYIEDGKTALIRSQNIYNHTFTPEGLVYITEEQAEKMKGVEIESNDILMNITGYSVARVTVVPREFIPARVNQHVSIIRCNKDIDPYYILAVLTSNNMQRYLISIAKTGGTRAALTKKMIQNIEIPILPVIDMNRISNIYKTIFEKIELNNQMIDTLEEMASTLFKRWFVDFEFPDENGNPYKSSGGKMIDSELGEIPEGWEIIPLSEVCSVKDGTHDSPKQVEIGYPLVTSKHLKKNKIDVSEAKLISQQDYDKTNVRSKVHQFDILISMIGTVGRTFYVTDNKIEFAIKNIGLIKTSEIRNLSTFIYLQFTSERVANFITLNTTGSTQQYISLTNLRKIPMLMPSESILNKFHDLVASTFNISECLKKEIDTLTGTRDTLLPKFLSGELEV